MAKFYVVKLLTNMEDQGAPSIAEYAEESKALVAYHNTLAAYINAPDVKFAVVEVQNEVGNTLTKEIVDHRPVIIPEPEPEEEEEEEEREEHEGLL